MIIPNTNNTRIRIRFETNLVEVGIDDLSSQFLELGHELPKDLLHE